jgi:hypothetical protein
MRMVRQLASEAKVTPANKHPFGFDAADCMAQLSGKEPAYWTGAKPTYIAENKKDSCKKEVGR